MIDNQRLPDPVPRCTCAADEKLAQTCILIVEDHELMLTVLLDFVRQTFPEFAVASAKNGAQALAQVQQLLPTLVLMDVHLPDANGIELISQCRELHPTIRVIVLSHSLGLAYEEHARSAGACGYVVKDQAFSELEPAIRDALGLTAGSRGG